MGDFVKVAETKVNNVTIFVINDIYAYVK